jgi:hypothetical protein
VPGFVIFNPHSFLQENKYAFVISMLCDFVLAFKKKSEHFLETLYEYRTIKYGSNLLFVFNVQQIESLKLFFWNSF